jgi:hypothetical protein
MPQGWFVEHGVAEGDEVVISADVTALDESGEGE